MSTQPHVVSHSFAETTASVTQDMPYIPLDHNCSGMPEGWTVYVHPRGWIYFRNDEYNVVTDEDIRNPAVFFRIDNYCHEGVSKPPDGMEVYLLGTSDPSFNLLVDHKQCMAVYGKEDTKAEKTISNVLRSRLLYWGFLKRHPVHVPITKGAYSEAVDAIKFYYFENLTHGLRSIAPFSKVECEDLLRLLDAGKVQFSDISPVTTTLVAWVLQEIYSFRRADTYGHLTYSQLNQVREASVRPLQKNIRLPLFLDLIMTLVINGLLFGIPKTYLEHVKNASVFHDRLSSLQESWEKYYEQLTREYSDFILVSTVLLSATVSMLSAVDISQTSQTCAILSALSSLGSITIGVFLVWRHQRNIHSRTSTFAYIHNARNNFFGLTGYAVLLSIPVVLLVWSLIAFIAAIVAYTLQNLTDGSQEGVAAWVIVGIFAVIFACVMAGLYSSTVMWRWQSDLWFMQYIRRLFR
ncbi:hypothetical protein B0H21DRAFT_893784 [Amylocystis lapponica]|nr:hypothetical protein B0H21DRAFT_893784 [Amylocystis lapponica]